MVNILALLIGFVGLFSGIILDALVYMNIVNGFLALIIITVIAIIGALVTILTDLMTQGVSSTFLSAKIHGNPIAVILRNDKALRFIECKLREGLAETKRYGKFIIVPDSIYNMPNGTAGFLAYHKYGVSLNPAFVQATERLRELGVNDIEQVERLNAENAKDKKQIVLNLDANVNNKRLEMEKDVK